MTLRILPDAEAEAAPAALWYEQQRSGLGDDFLSQLSFAYQGIEAGPYSPPLLEYYSGRHRVRRLLLQRFPYAVIFLVRDRETLVLAVAHVHRKPLYWLPRLSK